MKRFVLDTSVFTNPDIYAQFAAEPHTALHEFLALARRSGAEFFMPGSVYEELGHLRDLDELASEFETVVRIRSPRKYEVMIPGALLHEFTEEVRNRIDRGLRIAEEHARMGRGPEATEKVDTVITRLRDKYRDALRRGILDSKEDADVLLLALELDGILVSADEGLREWADRAGVELVQPRYFARILEKLAGE
ncbi:MAG: RNA ligase partner protein [Thiohalorhabdus sp.]|uniref:RNA ligase partner protein n=1 Tax=Thiohalorhabdus sp. TaxID=3094134 RepID=UPI00397F36DA